MLTQEHRILAREGLVAPTGEHRVVIQSETGGGYVNAEELVAMIREAVREEFERRG